jgi:hypothetical protein
MTASTAWAAPLIAEYEAGRRAWTHTFTVYRMAYRAVGRTMPDPPELPPLTSGRSPSSDTRHWWQEEGA